MQDRMDPRHKSKYVAIWYESIPATAMLGLLINKKYPLNYVIFLERESYGLDSKENNVIQNYLKNNFVECINFEYNTLTKKPLYNLTYQLNKIYERINSHIIQYLPDFHITNNTLNFSRYYITNKYPLIENNIDFEKCIKIIDKSKLPYVLKSSNFCLNHDSNCD